MSLSDNDTIDLEMLNDYVAQVLPAVSSIHRAEIVGKLLEVGVEKPSDLQYVDEGDLELLNLKKVQVRKLIKDWDKEVSDALSCVTVTLDSSTSSLCPDSPGPSPKCSSEEPTSGESSSQETEAHIPWSKMPEELLADVKACRRPPPSLRKEMVRIIVNSLYKPDRPLPRMKVLRGLAQEVVNKYPKSFADQVDDVTIGTGYDSLVSQLVNRVDNISRQRSSGLKRKITSNLDAKPNKKHDAYGCINWQPLSLPDGETEESQEEVKEHLKALYKSDSCPDEAEVERKMDLTYASQRAALNQPDMAMLDIVEDWPFLFMEKHMLSHFQKLVGVNIKFKMMESFEKRGPKIQRFLRQHPDFCPHAKEVRSTLDDVVEACQVTGTETPWVLGLICLLCAYFGEDIRPHVIPEKDLGQPVDTKKLPGHPCLIAHGNPLQTSKLSLSVGQVVVRQLKNPISAICTWFAAYYIFNIHYPENSPGAPEFIQRFFLGINPETGSKKKGKKSGVHSGVMKLANKLASFENEWGL